VCDALCSMTDGEVATSVDDDQQPAADVSDVTTSPSRDLHDHYDDVTDDDAFLAGFRDCRREALRYLRQRDVDVGDELERHLTAVERTLRRRGEDLDREDGGSAESDLSPARRRRDGDDSALGVSLVDDEDAVTTEDIDDERGQAAAMSELSENACDLLRLAQNNPRINNVLNELFTLMDDDDDDDDDDCDCAMTYEDDEMKQEPMSSHDVMTSRSHDAVS